MPVTQPPGGTPLGREVFEMLVIECITIGSSAPVDVQKFVAEQGDFEAVVSAVLGGGHGQAPLLPRIHGLAVAGLK